MELPGVNNTFFAGMGRSVFMIAKILIKRRFKPGNTPQIVSLLNDIRALAMTQNGYMSGETLMKSQDPDMMVVISTWKDLDSWQHWRNNEGRKKFESMLEIYQVGPTEYEEYLLGTPLQGA
jgi:heme-degrading monooxygenase HmoA